MVFVIIYIFKARRPSENKFISKISGNTVVCLFLLLSCLSYCTLSISFSPPPPPKDSLSLLLFLAVLFILLLLRHWLNRYRGADQGPDPAVSRGAGRCRAATDLSPTDAEAPVSRGDENDRGRRSSPLETRGHWADLAGPRRISESAVFRCRFGRWPERSDRSRVRRLVIFSFLFMSSSSSFYFPLPAHFSRTLRCQSAQGRFVDTVLLALTSVFLFFFLFFKAEACVLCVCVRTCACSTGFHHRMEVWYFASLFSSRFFSQI